MTEEDVVIIGSGFGGSVAALRLAERGRKVLVLEKGRRFAPADFPRTNWDLRRWMWMPTLGMRGIMQPSFLEHLTVFNGVGVGGGSLVYANALPMAEDDFFRAPSWGGLADWGRELAPHYAAARRMLGVALHPMRTRGDEVLAEIAGELGRGAHFRLTEVGSFFGAPGVTVKDPYFGGEGPDRTGCTFCGGCMTGCRVGAKNTLDKNYLHLAERRGARVRAETEVTAVRERPGGGYVVETAGGEAFAARRVVLAGGVMGTVPLLLRMKKDGLPRLSPRVGDGVRTNNNTFIAVVGARDDTFSRGNACTSILDLDGHGRIEPIRYGDGSGFFRALVMPHAPAPTILGRLRGALGDVVRNPRRWARALTVDDFGRRTQIIAFISSHETRLSLRLGRGVRTGWREGVVTELSPGAPAPTAHPLEATEIARRFAEKVGGTPMSMATEMLFGAPTTVHILGGACMGATAEDGVVDARNRVFGHDELYVLDGSSIAANPGVNPSLTIAALAERAVSLMS